MKVVCKRHEVAHDKQSACPYCEPLDLAGIDAEMRAALDKCWASIVAADYLPCATPDAGLLAWLPTPDAAPLFGLQRGRPADDGGWFARSVYDAGPEDDD